MKQVLIVCMDGLKGLPQAIKTVFCSVNIQTCIVHKIRNSIKCIASKDQKEFWVSKYGIVFEFHQPLERLYILQIH